MNESLPPSPEPHARPFAPEKIADGGGCQKPLLVGCGLLALLLGVAAVVFVVKAKDVLAYAMNQLRTEVVAHLPEDAPESERQRLESSFDLALARIRSGELEPASLQALQQKLTSAASAAASRRLTRDELAGLIAALEKFNAAGKEPETKDPAGAPAGEPAAPPADPADPTTPPAEAAKPPAP